jgi:hypothetical protein
MNRPWLFVLVIMSTLSIGAGAQEDDHFTTRVLLPPGMPKLYVYRAIQGAEDRIDDPECAKVLDDFTDEQGRPLSATVGNLRLGVGARLWDLLFVDGTEEALCTDSATAAFTTLRGRVVYVCAARFASSAQPLTGLAGEILVIHEFLHSLGLPESPSTPGAFTSAQITERVWARCGDLAVPKSHDRHNWAQQATAPTKPLPRAAARPAGVR